MPCCCCWSYPAVGVLLRIRQLGDKDGIKIGSDGGEGDYSSTLEAVEEEKKRKKGGRDSDGGESDGATAQSNLVFFEEEEVEEGSGGKRGRRKWFELEELLRASVEMLGKGSLGMVYRVVLEDGCMVAVKRLKDANPCTRSEDAKDEECGVEGGVGIVGGLVVDLAVAAHAGEGVEHPRAAEAHQPDQAYLDQRGVVSIWG